MKRIYCLYEKIYHTTDFIRLTRSIFVRPFQEPVYPEAPYIQPPSCRMELWAK